MRTIRPALFARCRACPGWARANAYGFLYWLMFLLVLEPGNLYRAGQAGRFPSLSHEVVRIAVAAMLGATVTSIPMMLTRKFPLMGVGWLRRALVHVFSALGLALGLILVSCLLAAWIFEGAWLPSPADVRTQLANNWLLLVYALFAFTAIAHVAYLARPRSAPKPAVDEEAFLARIPVKTRGRAGLLDVAAIEWIETQGNYLALHAGSETHLIRETLARFEPKLDPYRFVRIHRRVMVSVDRILEIEPIANGDAILYLANGSELRMSRRYRQAVKERWNRLA